jgi:hypothetical protein
MQFGFALFVLMAPIVVTTAIRARGIFHHKNGIEKKILGPKREKPRTTRRLSWAV